MPSENRRRKDDTWTPDELNKALKGTKDDRRKRGDGDRRHHGEDSDRRRHKDDDDDRRSRRHRDRDGSPEVKLTEEDREKMRRERREKKEKGREPDKKPRQKEILPEKVKDGDEEDDRRRRHQRREEEGRKDRKSHKEDESRGHRDDKHKEKRHHESSSRRHHDDDNRHRQHESSSRHHRDDDADRQRHHNGSERRRPRDEDEDRQQRRSNDGDTEEDRERQRHERRERREKETGKEKEKTREDRDRRHEKTSDRSKEHRREEKNRDEDRHRPDREERHRSDREERHRSDREEKHRADRQERHGNDKEDRHGRDRDGLDERERASKHRTSEAAPTFSVNGKEKAGEEEKQADDDYDYEEDFEDYEDDFEDEEDPEMKEDGEMEEVLRALDEENNRLQSNSRRSNWSDSTELSDERFKDHRDEEDRKPKNPVSKGKTFINFVTAKQRVMDSTVASKARKRYDMFDLPPVGEYELYIRNFGRSDTKQAYVQTGDDDIEREVQTEEIEMLSKWTQQPSDQDAVVGGEGIAVASSGEAAQGSAASDTVRLEQFLERVGGFLFTILDEESISSTEEERVKSSRPTASFSEASTQLGFPDFLEARQVKSLSFCPSDPNSLLSIHTLPHEMSKEGDASSFDSLYILCVWNLSQMAYPYRICVSEMMITCACFSPTKASLVFAGMHDGSVSLWDLREPATQHKKIVIKDQTHVVRHATYMTAGVLETENHRSPVKAIAAVYSAIVGSLRDEETAESSSGLSFQLASVEEKASVNLWVVAEIPVPDPAGSENDLGLSPGGKIKLLRSSIIVLNNPNKYLSYCQELHALDLLLNPADLNHLYIATDAGCVVHGVRFGKRAYPPAYTPSVASPIPIVSIDFSPFGQPYFLAACVDGTLYLFHIRSEHPIATWKEFITGETILTVRWSRSRPAVFFVLDNNSNVLTFDLVDNGLAPIKTDNIRTADAVCMEVGSDPDLLSPGVNRPAQMAFALDNGTIECLSVSDQMRKQQPLEEDFLASYIDRF